MLNHSNYNSQKAGLSSSATFHPYSTQTSSEGAESLPGGSPDSNTPKEAADCTPASYRPQALLKRTKLPKHTDDEGSVSKPKRKKAKRACQACQRAHLTCADARPCPRCLQRGIGEQCRDGDRKKAKYLDDLLDLGTADIDQNAPLNQSPEMSEAFVQHQHSAQNVYPPAQPYPDPAQQMSQGNGPDGVVLQNHQIADNHSGIENVPPVPPTFTNGAEQQYGSAKGPEPRRVFPAEFVHHIPRSEDSFLGTPNLSSEAQQPPPVNSISPPMPSNHASQLSNTQITHPASSFIQLPVTELPFSSEYGALEWSALGAMSVGGIPGTIPTAQADFLNPSVGSAMSTGNELSFQAGNDMQSGLQSVQGGLTSSIPQRGSQVMGAQLGFLMPGSFMNVDPRKVEALVIGPNGTEGSHSPEGDMLSDPSIAQVEMTNQYMLGTDERGNTGQQAYDPNQTGRQGYSSTATPPKQYFPKTSNSNTIQKPGGGPASSNRQHVRFLNPRKQKPVRTCYSVEQGYPYADSFHALWSILERRLSTEQVKLVGAYLAQIRPSFIACAEDLSTDDLVHSEKNMQLMISVFEERFENFGTPTIILRRTCEVAAVNEEFCAFTGWDKKVLLGLSSRTGKGTTAGKASDGARGGPGRVRPMSIVELLDCESVVQFFHDFASLNISGNEGLMSDRVNVYTCPAEPKNGRAKAIEQRDGREKISSLECMLCWKIIKDVFSMPTMLVLNFLPLVGTSAAGVEKGQRSGETSYIF